MVIRGPTPRAAKAARWASRSKGPTINTRRRPECRGDGSFDCCLSARQRYPRTRPAAFGVPHAGGAVFALPRTRRQTIQVLGLGLVFAQVSDYADRTVWPARLADVAPVQ